ncbi:MAG: HAMP domain-containing histidine kinase [Gorillibacterium sp.]|nr:HAMP domain-containing histidine kinase [Gorillibacterium sp.]
MFIRTKLTLWYTSLLAALLLLFGIALYTFLSINFNKTQDQVMEDLARSLAESTLNNRGVHLLRNPITGETTAELPAISNLRYSGIYVQLVRPEDGVVLDSTLPTGFELPHTQPILERALAGKQYAQNVKLGSNTLRVYNSRITVPINNKIGLVLITQIATVVDNTLLLLHTVARFLILLGLFIIIAAATSGWFLARKAFKPIEKVISAAESVQNGDDLGRRIEFIGPPDEIGMLTSTINNMLGRVERTYRELEESNRMQRRFVSDASHELRTPLTTIRGNVEILQKVWRQMPIEGSMTDDQKREFSLEAMGDIAGEASRMSRLVNDLLALARADAGVIMYMEPIEIRALLEDVSRKASLLPRTVDWKIGNLSVLDGEHVYGNADYLRQMLFIFIENAFKYTTQGQVLLEGLAKPDAVGIRISDTGIGMDKDEIPHIFERFYRADVSRGRTTGTGLGLSIAQWIIDEHGGSIEVTTRLGVGTTFLIWLPIQAPQKKLSETIDRLELTPKEID